MFARFARRLPSRAAPVEPDSAALNWYMSHNDPGEPPCDHTAMAGFVPQSVSLV